ncbi:MAG: HAMP domain-containing protein [Sedimentisphaerales bacterium]|nr:HAMP domain-containing protein [Sedimentisphaerales bacterium]
MARKQLLWQLYPSYLVITLIALVAAGLYTSRSFREIYIEQIAEDLEYRAYLARQQILGALETSDIDKVEELCRELGSVSSTRITVILTSGKVLGDSQEEPENMDNHGNRPEIIQAFNQGKGRSLRPSPTLGINMMYIALRLQRDQETIGVVRTALPVKGINQVLHNIYLKIFLGALAIAVCAAIISFFVSRRITRPIIEMKQSAQDFAEGRLDQRVPVPDSAELGALAKSLNQMARQLNDRIQTITRQRNELEVILSSMTEGVLAVDSQRNVVSVNKAAAKLLGIDPTEVQARNIEEVTRNADLLRFVRETLDSDSPVEAEMAIRKDGDRFFQLHGAGLSDSYGKRSGAVIVFTDMTRMRRLENVRRDFVSNVSHELRTPVTSIQGFVEALLDEKIREPEQVNRYLKIIAKHSDRLNAIIEDLLSLSRLEEDSERRKISFEVASLKPVLAAAIELSNTKIQDKQAAVHLFCDDDIQARINPALLEQAILNLIDNAIKYTPPNGNIRINVEKSNKQLCIAIKDNGCGIEKKHLSRIFERFYVVDKSRSRKLGGTGLGLAIVKHIAQVHDGYVTVKSTPSEGSTFTIHLPCD